ncbi:MAG: hypothetical protein ACM3VT_04820 [Solirubrobacterales bacterium]
MRKALLFAVASLLGYSGSAIGAIVYSGSQNVTIGLSPMNPMDPMSPMSAMVTIDVADQPVQWDDFQVNLWLKAMNPMTPGGMVSMGNPTTLVIVAPGGSLPGVASMGMSMSTGIGGIVGTGGVAMNLSFGDMIGPDSPLNDGSLLTGSGNFGPAGGYIGLMMQNPLGGAYYGWLHMASQSGFGTETPTILFDGWAYDNEAGAAIAAGDTGVVPVPGAVCLVGIGLMGLARSQNRRNHRQPAAR